MVLINFETPPSAFNGETLFRRAVPDNHALPDKGFGVGDAARIPSASGSGDTARTRSLRLRGGRLLSNPPEHFVGYIFKVKML